MARIAVAGLQHETNCFVAEPTDFAYFLSHRDRRSLLNGSDVIAGLADTSFALAGFLKAMRQHTIVPLLWTSGGAGGVATHDAYERTRRRSLPATTPRGAAVPSWAQFQGTRRSRPSAPDRRSWPPGLDVAPIRAMGSRANRRAGTCAHRPMAS
jgi:hypothetical protein